MTVTMQQDPMFLYHLDAFYVAQNRPRKGKEGKRQKHLAKAMALNARLQSRMR